MSEASQHIVKSFEQELHRLRDLVTAMGGVVERELALASQAVLQNDPEAAEQAIAEDPRVDEFEREIERFAIRLLALRQPMGLDLRLIVAALKISVDLERIGDYATNLAKRSRVLAALTPAGALSGISHMIRLVQEELKLVIDAVGENDAEKAVRVWSSDKAVDDVYNAIFRELVTYMMEDPRYITPCAHLLFIAKNLERIGDHATNVAELLYYAVSGETLPETRPKGEDRSYAVEPR